MTKLLGSVFLVGCVFSSAVFLSLEILVEGKLSSGMLLSDFVRLFVVKGFLLFETLR